MVVLRRMTSKAAYRWVSLMVLLMAGAASGYFLWPEREVSHGPGILVAEQPLQTAATSLSPWERDEYTIAPLAAFEVRARVLHKRFYHHGRESDLSPIDLALGWGAMSDQRVLDQISISQSGRWYEWQSSRLPIPRQEVVSSSANMHMIPADDEVDRVLRSVRVGDIVRFTGYLVDVRAKDGWHWRSSLSRTDEGNGACELVWLRNISVE